MFHKAARLLILTVLLSTIRAPLLLVAAGNNNIEVEVFSLFYNKHSSVASSMAGNCGLNASFHARKKRKDIAEYVTLNHLPSNNHSGLDALEKKVAELKDDKKILVILGPTGDTSTMTSLPYLTKHNIVAFSPFTGASFVRGWRRNLYFFSVEPLAEALTLVRYALGHLRVRRLGFAHLRNVSFGDTEQRFVSKMMERMGYKLCGTFALESTLKSPATDKDFDEEWERFASTRPQAVLNYGLPIHDGVKFVKRLAKDSRTLQTHLLTPFPLQHYVIHVFGGGHGEVLQRFQGSVITTGTNPLATDSQYKAVQRFQKEMKEYLEHRGTELPYNNSEHHLTNDADGELMVYGWIIGEAVSKALSSREWLKDRSTFLDSLYDQRRYLIDDLVFGDYGGECSGKAAALGAMCRCNQGGKAVYVKRLTKEGRLEGVKEGFVSLGMSECRVDGSRLRPPLAALSTFMEDDPVLLGAAKEWHEGAKHLVGVGSLGEYDRFFLHAINVSTSNVLNTLRREEEERLVDAVLGVTDVALLSTSTFVVIDPVLSVPRLTRHSKRVIYLSATLEQQLFVIAKYLSKNSSMRVHSVIRSPESYEINRLLSLMLAEFGGKLSTFVSVRQRSSIQGHLPADGDVFVIGLSEGDVLAIAEHLNTTPDLRVYISFVELALHYETFVKVFGTAGVGSASSDRVLFATNLPHWADSNASETVKKFHNAVGNKSKWTPLSLMGFAAGNLLRANLPYLKEVNADTLSNLFFMETNLRADDMRYGPYNTEACNGAKPNSWGDCMTNYGATDIALWSMARALDASVLPVTNPVTLPLQYDDPDAGRLTGTALVLVVVSGLFFMLLVVGVGAFLFSRHLGDVRDNVNAPKELTDPVTLIFTDIESSTAQWAAHPELMPDAVATHHRLIRALIAQYRCYEVKTVGDSFMIACHSPSDAVCLAGDLQLSFLNHDWGTSALDDSYIQFELQRAEEEEGYVPHTAQLDAGVYGRLWRGLRVRVGIHTGLCDIRYDEVTKGYDYYGRTSNMAARTESVANGGQVLMTGAAYMALTTAERARLSVLSLGHVTLRGVPNPVEMYQLNAVPGRVFASLRLDHDSPDVGEDASMSEGNSTHAGLTESARQVAISMESLLSVFTPAQRQKMLLPLCERWRVGLAQKSGEWSEACCHDVVNRLAVRVGRVADFRLRGASFCSSLINIPVPHSLLPAAEVRRPSLQSRSVPLLEVGESPHIAYTDISRSLDSCGRDVAISVRMDV